jgi:hypothetical protein
MGSNPIVGTKEIDMPKLTKVRITGVMKNEDGSETEHVLFEGSAEEELRSLGFEVSKKITPIYDGTSFGKPASFRDEGDITAVVSLRYPAKLLP